jgi:hypothetical protein
MGTWLSIWELFNASMNIPEHIPDELRLMDPINCIHRNGKAVSLGLALKNMAKFPVYLSQCRRHWAFPF